LEQLFLVSFIFAKLFCFFRIFKNQFLCHDNLIILHGIQQTPRSITSNWCYPPKRLVCIWATHDHNQNNTVSFCRTTGLVFLVFLRQKKPKKAKKFPKNSQKSIAKVRQMSTLHKFRPIHVERYKSTYYKFIIVFIDRFPSNRVDKLLYKWITHGSSFCEKTNTNPNPQKYCITSSLDLLWCPILLKT